MSVVKFFDKIALAACGLALVTNVAAASITVTGSTRENGRLSSLTLAFPAAATASSIWVASGTGDAGTVLGNWQTLAFGADVAAGETACTVPVHLPAGETVMRLIMLADNDEYTELESISAANGAYITTGFKPSGRDLIRCDFKFDKLDGNSAIFGARISAYNSSFCMLQTSNNGFRYDYANEIHDSFVLPVVGRRYLAEMDFRSLRIDGKPLNNCSRTGDAVDVLPDCPVMVFAMNNNGTAVCTADATVYSLKAWFDTDDRANTLITDLVPCRKKDGTVGMLNRQTGGFQTNVGTLTGGNAKAHSTLGTVVDSSEVIDACGLKRTMSVVASYRRSRKAMADLAFSTALADSMVIAAYGTEDAGEELADWPNSVVLSVVPALTEQMTVTIPATIDDSMKVIRYFLVPRCGSSAYDREFGAIRATGTQYAITSFTPSLDTLVKSEFTLDTVSGTQVPFGCRQQPYTRAFSVLHTADNGFRLDFNGYIENSRIFATAGQKYQIDAAYYLDVDGTRLLTAPDKHRVEFTAGAPLTLFALNSAGAIGSMSKAVCHSFRAWRTAGDDSSRVLDLMACERNGEVGFYNRVDGKFYGNSGTGEFEAVGPESVNANAEVIAVSAAIDAPRQVGMRILLQ